MMSFNLGSWLMWFYFDGRSYALPPPLEGHYIIFYKYLILYLHSFTYYNWVNILVILFVIMDGPTIYSFLLDDIMDRHPFIKGDQDKYYIYLYLYICVNVLKKNQITSFFTISNLTYYERLLILELDLDRPANYHTYSELAILHSKNNKIFFFNIYSFFLFFFSIYSIYILWL